MRTSQKAALVGIVVGLAVGFGAGAIGLGAIFGLWMPIVIGLFAGTTFFAEYVKVSAHSNLADRR